MQYKFLHIFIHTDLSMQLQQAPSLNPSNKQIEIIVLDTTNNQAQPLCFYSRFPADR